MNSKKIVLDFILLINRLNKNGLKIQLKGRDYWLNENVRVNYMLLEKMYFKREDVKILKVIGKKMMYYIKVNLQNVEVVF